MASSESSAGASGVTALQALVRQARDLGDGLPVAPSGAAPLSGAEAEVARQLQICNACRYCEGFCAVFPAMARRLEFPKADIHYLANLCHNCGACLHACQYAPPHEFAVSVPQAMARVRADTYSEHAWPAAFGRAYKANGLVVALAMIAALSLFLALGAARTGMLWGHPGEGSFYAVFPHGLMVSMFAPVFLFAVLALGIGVTRFWRSVSPGSAPAGQAGEAAREALNDTLVLRYLDGGHGEGCHEADDRWTLVRRRMHHLTFYGFALCFASTSVATIYHYVFGWVAPYGWTTLPKLLGTVGGVMLTIGCAGLLRLRLQRSPSHASAEQRPMDLAFITLLLVVGASGLLLAVARQTPAMPLLLCLHLGSVMAFFATMPYGKFAHGLYRAAALLKWSIEKRQPSRLRLGSD